MSEPVYIVEFDYRSDGGPELVGPFIDRSNALAWLDSLKGPGWESAACVVPVYPPEPAR